MDPTDNPEIPSDGSDESDDQDVSARKAKKVRSSRACVACRRMKTRCEIDEALGSACKLCIRARRPCIMQSIPRRRKRKTTERVADLEQKINALTALLASNESNTSGEPTAQTVISDESPQVNKYELDPEASNTLVDDALDRGLLDWGLACKAFERFKSEMCHFFPFVVFPASSDAALVKDQQPLLFFAIVVVALSSMNVNVNPELGDMLIKDLALRVMYRGERSLEMVQVLLVHISFYARARQTGELNFNQMIHIASTMALDIGLGRRQHKAAASRQGDLHQLESLAGRRAWLGCYYVATSVSMSLRHPAFIRWSVYIEECLDVLSVDPPALPTDAWLCDLINIQHIAEDASVVFSMDDPGSVVNLRDVKIQYQLGGFRQQLEHWRRHAKVDLNLPYVRHVAASKDLFIHEIALHPEHNIDEFRSPLRQPAAEPTIEDMTSTFADMNFVPARIEAFFACLSAIHEAFDGFIAMDFTTRCALPNLFFVRTGYAARALRKLLDICRSQAELEGKSYINIRELKFEEYMTTLVDLLSKVHAATNSQVARAFCMVLTQIKVQGLKPSRQLAPTAETAAYEAPLAPSSSFQPAPVPQSTEASTLPSLNQSNSGTMPSYAVNPVTTSPLEHPSIFPTLATNSAAALDPRTEIGVPAWLADQGNDAYMTGIDVLQWFDQDFAFEDPGVFDYDGAPFRLGDGTWQQ